MTIIDDQTTIRILKENDATIVEFKEPCVSDLDGIAQSATQLKHFVEDHRPSNVIFDFERVNFISSQVLGVLLEIRAKLINWQGKIGICSTNAQLKRVFKITNLDQIFSFFTDRRTAVTSMKNTETEQS